MIKKRSKTNSFSTSINSEIAELNDLPKGRDEKGLNKEKEDNEKAECRKDPFNNDADEDDRGYDYKNDQADDQ